MKSLTTPDFWQAYAALSSEMKEQFLQEGAQPAFPHISSFDSGKTTHSRSRTFTKYPTAKVINYTILDFEF